MAILFTDRTDEDKAINIATQSKRNLEQLIELVVKYPDRYEFVEGDEPPVDPFTPKESRYTISEWASQQKLVLTPRQLNILARQAAHDYRQAFNRNPDTTSRKTASGRYKAVPGYAKSEYRILREAWKKVKENRTDYMDQYKKL